MTIDPTRIPNPPEGVERSLWTSLIASVARDRMSRGIPLTATENAAYLADQRDEQWRLKQYATYSVRSR